ncbi:MAG: hypothetical protein IPM77_00680 [Crocinitomicaceae bacterium]|nr:hypothetical protein [Crocinitomicaceae bacterium]
MRNVLIAICVVGMTAVACEKEQLNTGEVYRSKELKIEFRDYTDSRCPIGTNCIWEGEASVYLKAESGDEETSFTLSGIGNDTTVFGHKIVLEDLLPYPEEGKEISFKDKEVKLKVSKL